MTGVLEGTALKRRIQIGIRRVTDRNNPRKMIPILLVSLVLLMVLMMASSAFFHPVWAVSQEDYPNRFLQLSFTGDAMMGRYIEQRNEARGYDDLLSGVKDVWANSDCVFTNLEYVMLVRDPSNYTADDKPIIMSASTDSVQALLDGGINVFGVANNHASDYRAKGFLEEITWMHQQGLNFSGYFLSSTQLERYEQDPDLLELYQAFTEQKYTVLECDNGMTIGFLALVSVHTSSYPMTQYLLKDSNSELYEYVLESAMNTDLTVVYIHSGHEYSLSTIEEQEELAHSLIDAGADIVIGAHPHVLQPVELYGDGIIFYSLGNFISDQNQTGQRDSVIVQYNLDETGAGSFELIPVRINNGYPQVASGRYYIYRINRTMTKGLDRDAYYLNGDGHVVIPWSKTSGGKW